MFPEIRVYGRTFELAPLGQFMLYLETVGNDKIKLDSFIVDFHTRRQADSDTGSLARIIVVFYFLML